MPELLEIEMYRRGAAAVVGRTISSVDAPDDWYLKGIDAASFSALVVGARVEQLRRIGKLMIVDTDAAPIGLRFGMTGRLVIDRSPIIESLEYSSKRLDPEWDRFSLHFGDGGSLAMNDPRRLGGVEVEPDTTQLGPDAWSVSAEVLTDVFGRYRVATKALLLNQKRVSGLGNLLVDELLWRSSLSPLRPANEVKAHEVEELHRQLAPMLDELYSRGGSTCGDLFDARTPGGVCPRDGHPLGHGSIGGRSTWWCATHQR